MKKLLMVLACGLLAAGAWGAPITGKHTFKVGDKAFLLDGKPFVIRCGEMHFARIPRDLWRHRIQMVKAAGFNAVCAYMFWNNHEPVRGRYEFTGEKDVAEFCRIAQEEGMWVVLRPGPYTCAEWEFGGLPWWLLKNDDIKLRTSDPRYLEPACEYLYEVGKVLKNQQITHGGNILMVQIENEYGFWGSDQDYMRKQYNAVRKAGFDVPGFCCNPPYNMRNGLIPELLPVVNFGSDPAGAFRISREVRPKGPLMCGEYYPAWFDSWGEKHNVKDAGAYLRDVEYMLQQKASFSVYMAHGGTTFGWWAGCNAPFRPQTSSYDYDAPVSEAGWKHPTKFDATRELFVRYLNEGEQVPDEAPAPNPVQAKTVKVTPTAASLWGVPADVPASTDPICFEKADLGWGYAVYRTTIPAGRGGELAADVRDLGVVRVDGEDVGFFDRRYAKARVKIEPADKPRRLEILVEEMARYNFGHIMHESRKGILGRVTLGGEPLTGWTMARINLNEDAEGGLARLGAFKATDLAAKSGTAYRYTVELEAKDTFLEMRDWKKGMVRVNGRWIGRYWSIGPTQTMYVPGCWLKDGANEIVILDVVGTEPATELRFVDKPILGEMRPETDYFAFQPRPKLAKPLDAAKAAMVGEFRNDTKRQDIRFRKSVRGRYFALESLNAWDNQPFAAAGEIDLVDARGKNIPHSKWTIAACDSEERASEDGSAENLVDGQTANFWHSEWSQTSPQHPHYVVIDLGQEETVGGFNFTPRQSTNGGGRIKGYRVYVLPTIALLEPPKPGPALVPYPQEVKMRKGIVTLASLDEVRVRRVSADKFPKAEAYALRVTKGKGVEIAAADDAGEFYARETLKQLAKKTAKGYVVPCCEIKDWPAFGWRGAMWDDCRHFFGKEAIKKMLDAMAAHKMNVFHWHLTEDQGWRLAIPKFPELVKYGAVRPKSDWPDGLGKTGLDETPYGPYFYTEDDVKEILAYAKERHIRVIPEIELPGHALAALAAFPQFSCRGKALFGGRDHGEPRAQWGISEDIFCAGNDDAIKFLEEVLDYVVSIFPDEVVHIGGDEAPKKRWNECAKCQARIKKLGLKNAHELQGWVTKHFTEYLAKKGRRVIGWDEITECDLPQQTMVMNWHGTQVGINAAKKGHDVVFSPTSHCYFDYRQSAIEEHQAKGYGYPTWAGELNLRRVHSLDPLAGIPEEFHKHIFGVQGNIWTESVSTPEELEWKFWPRAAAIAEVGWSGGNAHPWEDFARRVTVDMKRMSKAGYNVRK